VVGEYAYRTNGGPPVNPFSRRVVGSLPKPVTLLELGDGIAGARLEVEAWSDDVYEGAPVPVPAQWRSREIDVVLTGWSRKSRWQVVETGRFLDQMGELANRLEAWSAGYPEPDLVVIPPGWDPDFELTLLSLSESHGAVIRLHVDSWKSDRMHEWLREGEPHPVKFRMSLSEMWDSAKACRSAIAQLDAIPTESASPG
jgi:hypothetical protein